MSLYSYNILLVSMSNKLIKTRIVGDSYVFSVPRSIVEQSKIQVGDYIGCSYQEGKIIFSPAKISF